MTPVPTDIRHIVVPTDFSPGARRAVDFAATLAQRLGATVTLLHAIEPVDAPVPQSLVDAETVGATGALDDLATTLRARGLTVEPVVERRAAAAATVALARDRRADLIVMGTHGRTGLSRLLLGSVAEHVLRHADCPVLTVRTGTPS